VIVHACAVTLPAQYRVGQKPGPVCFTAYNFRHIELNISRNLFESILENSSAIWRITLTVNKMLIKVTNYWQ